MLVKFEKVHDLPASSMVARGWLPPRDRLNSWLGTVGRDQQSSRESLGQMLQKIHVQVSEVVGVETINGEHTQGLDAGIAGYDWNIYESLVRGLVMRSPARRRLEVNIPAYVRSSLVQAGEHRVARLETLFEYGERSIVSTGVNTITNKLARFTVSLWLVLEVA